MALTLHYDFLNNPSLTGQTVGPDTSITRATKATMVDADGYIREVQSGEARFTGATFNHNLLLQSQDFTTTWTNIQSTDSANAAVAPDGTTTADKLIENTATSTHAVSQNVSVKAQSTYTYSVYAKAAERDWIVLYDNSGSDGRYFDITNGVAGTTIGTLAGSGIESIGNGWYRCYITTTVTAATISAQIYLATADNTSSYTGDGSSGVYLWGAQLERVDGKASSTPSTYIPTTTAAVTSLTGTSTKGLLVEEARTQLAIWTEDISNAAWVASNVTKGTDSVTAPDGAANTNVRLTASAGNGTLLQTLTAASATWVYSVYMKRVTGTGNIDLTLDGGSTWTTKTLTGSWQRFDITQAAVTNPQFGVRIVTSGDAIDFWGSELNSGKTFPTSYISNNSATASVTRNKDDILTSDVSWYSQGAGTFYYAGRNQFANNPASIAFFEASDNSSSDRFVVWSNSANNLRVDIVVSGGDNATISGASIRSDDTLFRVATGLNTNDSAMYADGTSVGTDNTVGLITNVATLNLGTRFDETQQLNGHIAEIRYYNERLDNGTLLLMSQGIFPTFGLSFVRDITRALVRDLVSDLVK